jgi:NADPH-dependent 7-cyano-7-deazaguanine reductase QueF-like protein
VIGEFAFEWDWSKNFDDFATDMDLDYKHGLWFGLFTPTPILPMSWWWEYFENRGMTTYFRGVREINDLMLKAGNGNFEKIDMQSDQLNLRGVKCGKTYFIYMLNETGEDKTSTIRFPVGSDRILSVKSFDPVSLKYNDIRDFEINELQAFLPDVKLESKNEKILIVEIK